MGKIVREISKFDRLPEASGLYTPSAYVLALEVAESIFAELGYTCDADIEEIYSASISLQIPGSEVWQEENQKKIGELAAMNVIFKEVPEGALEKLRQCKDQFPDLYISVADAAHHLSNHLNLTNRSASGLFELLRAVGHGDYGLEDIFDEMVMH